MSTAQSPPPRLLLLVVLGGELGVGLLLVRVGVGVGVRVRVRVRVPSKGWSRPPSFHSPERDGFLVRVRGRVRV